MSTEAPAALLEAHEPNGIAASPPRGRRTALLYALLTPLSFLLVGIGGALQGYAQDTYHAIAGGLLFLALGYALCSIAFPRRRQERQAFLISYSICVLVGGLAQLYAVWAFGAPISTLDAQNFYAALLPSPPYYTLHQLNTVWVSTTFLGRGAPLAVFTWQYVYHYVTALGLAFAPYIGIMFNALLVGLTGSIVVATARELFGPDTWRLRRAGLLYAFCGTFIMFGAIFLRDSFTLFFNALVMFALVRFLQRRTTRSLVFAGVVVLIATACTWYLRHQSTYFYGLFCVLAFTCWYWRGERTLAHTLTTLAIPLIVAVIAGIGLWYVDRVLDVLLSESEDYVTLAAEESRGDSLGMSLVINQPMPVRAVLGSAVVLAYPIPIWAYLYQGANEHEIIKNWQGFYNLYLLPLVFVGGAIVAYRVLFRAAHLQALLFLLVYAAITLVAVGATSIETRHIGQFMPAWILLAVVPDTRRAKDRRTVMAAGILWLFLVVMVHLLWALMRFT